MKGGYRAEASKFREDIPIVSDLTVMVLKKDIGQSLIQSKDDIINDLKNEINELRDELINEKRQKQLLMGPQTINENIEIEEQSWIEAETDPETGADTHTYQAT